MCQRCEAFFCSETRRAFRFYSRDRKSLRFSLQLVDVFDGLGSPSYD
ncbi:hypothetical protein RMSM_01161 [Rhodopirellula maiorica SM1]|uniref:Uncharacterized protein n=1 Tax=Rhodopirellula maiorica SM1 TaxID=1265738 RepID=M5RRF4_9BACT|nr:hypothetical protein RMSM_01161 [Rhodopirellula maiorica SM1]